MSDLRSNAVWGGLLLASLVACTTAAGPEKVASRASAILGGSPERGVSAVVMIHALDAKGVVVGLCTGTVIAPRAVLTAGHCASPLTVSAPRSFQIFAGDDATKDADWNDPKRSWKLATAHIHPAFDGVPEDGHDLAVLVASEPLPLTPIPLRRTPLDASIVGQSARVVGFGITDAGDIESWGTRNATASHLSRLDELFLVSDDTAHNFCRGDSGGPLMLAGAKGDEVVAVASHHAGRGEDKVACSSTAFASRVDIDLAFLDQVLAPLEAADGEADAGSDGADLADGAPANAASPAEGAPPASGCSVGGAGQPARSLPLAFAAMLGLAWARRRGARTRGPYAPDRRAGAP
jgi:V8-like Glu-specific endopeptidase